MPSEQHRRTSRGGSEPSSWPDDDLAAQDGVHGAHGRHCPAVLVDHLDAGGGLGTSASRCASRFRAAHVLPWTSRSGCVPASPGRPSGGDQDCFSQVAAGSPSGGRRRRSATGSARPAMDEKGLASHGRRAHPSPPGEGGRRPGGLVTLVAQAQGVSVGHRDDVDIAVGAGQFGRRVGGLAGDSLEDH